jgi:hypothetical protein
MTKEAIDKLKFGVIIFLVFIPIVYVGMASHELVRNTQAQSLGYHIHSSLAGFLFFSNDTIIVKLDSIARVYPDFKQGKETETFKTCRNQNEKNMAFIQLSGLVFSIGISLFGLVLLLKRRKKNNTSFAFVDWVGVVLSLFVVREVLVSFIWIMCGSVFCDFAALYQYFNVPVFPFIWGVFIYGLLVVLIVLLKFVPRNRILPLFIGGVLGGLIGGVLWMYSLICFLNQHLQ